MAERPDPFDIAALESSLNDSATRVSTIWISFLTFGLYFVMAAGTVTHRQLLLEDPIKLPVLNIELSLVGFFFVAPILYVIFHTYVLIQVLLLGRTALAYNTALDRAVAAPGDNAAMRQRLANTLFAQIFAGSPRERDGWIGRLLKLMAWLTLAVAPVLVLLMFQIKFLPYHSHLVTWTIRGLILLELLIVLVLWRGVLRPDRDLAWRLVLRSWIALPLALVLAVFSWVVLTFPGEPHAQWARYWPQGQERTIPAECLTVSPISEVFGFFFDRLLVPGVDIVDDEKLAKIENSTVDRKLNPFEGKRTHSFENRDLNCSLLPDADLRRAGFAGALLKGAFLIGADLEGANFERAQLQGAEMELTKLQDAGFSSAELSSANLGFAALEGAWFPNADLRGTTLANAQLQGAFLFQTQLQGADLSGALLQGADLRQALLQGASLEGAWLQLANLTDAQLQGAFLFGADFSAAWLFRVGLQGADLNQSSLEKVALLSTHVWRAKNARCKDAIVGGLSFEALLPTLNYDKVDNNIVGGMVPATSPDTIAKFIEQSVGGIPDPKVKETAAGRMRSGLLGDPANDAAPAVEEVWRQCEQDSDQAPANGDMEVASFLRNFFCDVEKRVCGDKFPCDAPRSADAVARGIIRNWYDQKRGDFSESLARGMLGEDGKSCPASRDLTKSTKQRLRALAAGAPPAPTEAP
jgi:uncharacterized protein YjbI with pentapeptide repeats